MNAEMQPLTSLFYCPYCREDFNKKGPTALEYHEKDCEKRPKHTEEEFRRLGVAS